MGWGGCPGSPWRYWALIVSSLLSWSHAAHGQTLIDFRQDLSFDRPEAWAMKYFASVSQLSPLGPPPGLEAGEVELALEAAWVPTLSEEQRTVGFVGTKPENLNRTSAFGRARATVGLPRGFALTLGYVPPVAVGGIEPHLVALSLRRTVWRGDRWHVGGGASAHWGTFQGDITCARAAAAAGEDPERNPLSCHEPSRDRMTLRQGGLEIAVSRPFSDLIEPYVTLSASYLDSRFRVNARYGSLVDRTLLVAHGVTWSATAGLSYSPQPRVRLAGELFYAPLSVVRSSGEPSRNDDLLNARLLLAWKVR